MSAPTGRDLSWISVQKELNVCRTDQGTIDYDKYRRDRLEEIEQHTRIPVIVYATDFLDAQKVRACEGQVSVDLTDLQGFVEVTKDLPDGPLDVILHSPGGLAEAAESIVQVLRTRFTPIRFIVPVAAKSAATMIALSGNEILMPLSAELGPIDPQFNLSDGAGNYLMVPAQVLKEQFERAKSEILANQATAAVWAPILMRYGIGLYDMANHAIRLSKDLVSTWLKNYMFAGDVHADAKANRVVNYLGDHTAFKSHGRRVSLTDLQAVNVIAKDIRREDAVLWQKVEAAWYSILHTFGGTSAFKLFENSRRNCFVRILRLVAQPVVIQKQGQQP